MNEVKCQYCDFTGTPQEVFDHLIGLVDTPIAEHSNNE